MTDEKKKASEASTPADAADEANASVPTVETEEYDASDEEAVRPLMLGTAATAGPRDALLDPRDEDIIPDAEEKGYHSGLERQGRESQSRFVRGSLEHLKAVHNAREEKLHASKAGFGREHVPMVTTEEAARGVGAAGVARAPRRP